MGLTNAVSFFFERSYELVESTCAWVAKQAREELVDGNFRKLQLLMLLLRECFESDRLMRLSRYLVGTEASLAAELVLLPAPSLITKCWF